VYDTALQSVRPACTLILDTGEEIASWPPDLKAPQVKDRALRYVLLNWMEESARYVYLRDPKAVPKPPFK